MFREFKLYAWGPTCFARLYIMLTRGTKLLEGNDEEEEEWEENVIVGRLAS